MENAKCFLELVTVSFRYEFHAALKHHLSQCYLFVLDKDDGAMARRGEENKVV